MKSLKYILLTAAASVLLSSCGNDFLDLTPHSNANEEDFYRTEEEIQTAMVAAYSTLHTIYGSLNVMYFFGALTSDDAYTTDEGAGNYKPFENSQVQANNGEVHAAWNQFYEAITRMNKILEKLDKSDIAGKEVYQAEMKFLRALYYFNMVQIWGGVPLVTKTMSISEAYQMGRASVESIYGMIMQDLEFCIHHLPVKGQVRAVGVPSKGAAYALLGKVYLTKGDKEKAAQTLLNIYNKEYELADTYEDLWDMDKKNGKESIFEIQYLGGVENPYSTYWALYTPANNLGMITLQGGGHNQVSDDLWNAYEPGDPRRDISIQDGWTTSAGEFDPTRFPLKWVDRNAPVSGKREAGNNNFIVLRYADVLLMLTEATGDPKYMNEVRNRVGLPGYGETGYPAQYNTVELAVEHERHVELATEFHRFFDLKRTGRAVEVMRNSWKNLQSFDEHNLVWPIPETVIDQNPELWAPLQNPGY